MLKTSSSTGSSIILQSIDVADKDKIGRSGSGSNETNLSNSFTSKRSTGAGFLISKGAKTDGNKTKKCVKATKGPDYLNPAAKKAFNYLRHAFI